MKATHCGLPMYNLEKHPGMIACQKCQFCISEGDYVMRQRRKELEEKQREYNFNEYNEQTR